MVEVIRNARRFGVSVLRAEQQSIGKTFAHPQTPYADRFKGSAYEIINQCPLIQGGLAMMTCEVVHEVPISENVVFFGRVTHVESHSGQPLVYFLRNWQELAR
jgi:flavin reductase (DIM6/NTAB) family NADH-FMN oxidoreductase RutF